MMRSLFLAAAFAVGITPQASAIECHTAIVFALDASRSIDINEARLQRDGLADALRDPAVQDLIIPYPGSGAVAMAFEWTNPDDQLVIAPWAVLNSTAAIEAFAAGLQSAPTIKRRLKTGIGAALRFAGAAHQTAPADCRRKVIDVSGDGPGNAGVLPRTIRAKGELDGIVINGLVIRHPSHDQAQAPGKDPLIYYRDHVAQGPGAFVIDVRFFDEYPAAIRRKIIRELSPAFAQK